MLFFRKDKTNKPSGGLPKSKEEGFKQNNTERGEITTNTTNKKIIKEYYELIPINWTIRRNEKVSRNIQPAKTESRRNRDLNRLITRSKIKL